jgi:HAMP domain-containing protein
MAFWRDVSIVWLSLFCFLGLAVPLVILYFLVRGMNRALSKAESLFHRVQGYSQQVRQQSETVSAKVAEPVVQAHKRFTRIQATFRRLVKVR